MTWKSGAPRGPSKDPGGIPKEIFRLWGAKKIRVNSKSCPKVPSSIKQGRALNSQTTVLVEIRPNLEESSLLSTKRRRRQKKTMAPKDINTMAPNLKRDITTVPCPLLYYFYRALQLKVAQLI